MFDCKRSSTDPLLRAMLKNHRLHLLRWPKKGVCPGDLVIEKQDGQTVRTPLSTVFVSAPSPATLVRPAEPMVNIEETFSGKLDAKATIGLLDSIATELGGAKGSFDGAYEKAAQVVLRIRSAQWNDCDPAELSMFVGGAEVRSDQGLFREDEKLYIISGVATAKSIEIIGYDGRGVEIAADAEVAETAAANANLKSRKDGATGIVYSGADPMPFGVELLKLELRKGGWAISGADNYVAVRGSDAGFDKSAFAVLGDASTGDVFIDLVDASL
ncbi:hypothetical protein [Bradyrhizobium sp. SZCCHNRI1058]|uniref:gasdermin n=1 Tax=Bradyrhizobium sp. SZCCHNRI1058 TaxID=3057279 RepID=UPI002915D092|nr:hypothetical protein [Bradyrhizobium sp. SZCCHNRI1058]